MVFCPLQNIGLLEGAHPIAAELVVHSPASRLVVAPHGRARAVHKGERRWWHAVCSPTSGLKPCGVDSVARACAIHVE